MGAHAEISDFCKWDNNLIQLLKYLKIETWSINTVSLPKCFVVCKSGLWLSHCTTSCQLSLHHFHVHSVT